MTKQKINRAIQHLGMQIVGRRGDGYFYFVGTDPNVGQIGESVTVCYLHQQSLTRWVEDAESALAEYKTEQLELANY